MIIYNYKKATISKNVVHIVTAVVGFRQKIAAGYGALKLKVEAGEQEI